MILFSLELIQKQQIHFIYFHEMEILMQNVRIINLLQSATGNRGKRLNYMTYCGDKCISMIKTFKFDINVNNMRNMRNMRNI